MGLGRWVRRWPDWAAYAAAVWSLGYGALGLHWSFGGSGFPFGLAHDPAGALSVLANVRRETAAPVIAVLGLVAGIVAVVMRRGRPDSVVRLPLLAFAWVAAVALAIAIPDFRVLTLVAYAPIIILGAPFDWPEPVDFFDVIPWPIVNQGICIVGGLAWAATAIAYQRRARGACVACGRADLVPHWQSAAATRRWGTWAVAVAVVVPLMYAITRWAWALGFPLGLTEKFYREGQAVGLWWRGAALATLAIGGAVLTIGLVRPWGEVFPRWIPFVAGRRVPHALVVVPATFVAVIVTAAGLMFVRMSITGTFKLGDNPVTFSENFGALWPELLWPVWGVALGAATLAYHYRTRGRCATCGRE